MRATTLSLIVLGALNIGCPRDLSTETCLRLAEPPSEKRLAGTSDAPGTLELDRVYELQRPEGAAEGVERFTPPNDTDYLIVSSTELELSPDAEATEETCSQREQTWFYQTYSIPGDASVQLSFTTSGVTLLILEKDDALRVAGGESDGDSD